MEIFLVLDLVLGGEILMCLLLVSLTIIKDFFWKKCLSKWLMKMQEIEICSRKDVYLRNWVKWIRKSRQSRAESSHVGRTPFHSLVRLTIDNQQPIIWPFPTKIVNLPRFWSLHVYLHDIQTLTYSIKNELRKRIRHKNGKE